MSDPVLVGSSCTGHYFRQSLCLGKLFTVAESMDWIDPVFKKGRCAEMAIYHPVSLTSTVCKCWDTFTVVTVKPYRQ